MGSNLHAVIIMTIMVVLFALSMFMTPQHQHLKMSMLAPHGEQQCSPVQQCGLGKQALAGWTATSACRIDACKRSIKL